MWIEALLVVVYVFEFNLPGKIFPDIEWTHCWKISEIKFDIEIFLDLHMEWHPQLQTIISFSGKTNMWYEIIESA